MKEKTKEFYLKFFDRVSPDNFKNKIDLTEKLNIFRKNDKKSTNQWIWSHNDGTKNKLF